MIRAGVWRALSPTEMIHASREAYEGYLVRAAGRLDLDALTTAYQAVCQAYPQLSAELAAGDNGPVFAPARVRPEVLVRVENLDQPMAGVELDQHRSLSALSVVRDGDEATVCMVIHHSIADAHHAIELLAALWSCYTDVISGVSVDPSRRPYPRSLEDLLAERGIRPSAPAAGVISMPLPSQQESPASPVVRHAVQHRLTTAQTTALVQLGHREHVTINGLLAGAVLLAEAEVRDLPLTDLAHWYSVNLRNRLTPRVGPTEGTNVLGGGGFKVTSDIEPDPVAIGAAIGARLRAGLADGTIQRSLLDLFSRLAGDGRPWQPSVAIPVVPMHNWGILPPMRTPDGLRLTNFSSASRTRGESAPNGYVVSSFDGRIGIHLVWPPGDPQLPGRIDCLRERLTRLLRDR